MLTWGVCGGRPAYGPPHGVKGLHSLRSFRSLRDALRAPWTPWGPRARAPCSYPPTQGGRTHHGGHTMDDFTLADDDLFPDPGPALDGMTAINSAGVRFRLYLDRGPGVGVGHHHGRRRHRMRPPGASPGRGCCPQGGSSPARATTGRPYPAVMADNVQEPPATDDGAERCLAQVGRFLTIPDVAAELAVSVAQVRALLEARALRGIQIGGRGQWRIERAELESFIARAYQAQENRHDAQTPQPSPSMSAPGPTVPRRS